MGTIVGKIGILLFGFNSKIYGEQLKRLPDGIIRDMQHFLDTFNFLFNDYDAYIESRMGGETSDWCCCRVAYQFYSQKKDTVSKKEWEKFCKARNIPKEQELQMWFEINSNPYLASKTSFDSETMWQAVRKNYDKVSGRLDRTELKTLIRENWKLWDEECNEENTKRHRDIHTRELRNLLHSVRIQELPISLTLSGEMSAVVSEGVGNWV